MPWFAMLIILITNQLNKFMYLFLDTETGGIDLDKSLLTVYFLVTSDHFEKMAELDLKVKPDDGTYRVTAQALDVNKINLVEHDKEAMAYKQAGTQIYNLLRSASSDGSFKLIPVGHGVKFDILHVTDKLIGRNTFETFTSYRTIDTQSLSQFLISCNKIDGSKTSGSMASLGKYFNITPKDLGYNEEVLHSARYDTLLTLEVFKKMRGLIM
jgi:hypothetical protein